MGCCLEKISEDDEVPKKKQRPQITLIPPSDDEVSDSQEEKVLLSPNQGLRVVALFDYDSRNAGDLSFKKFDEFDVLKGPESDWLYVTKIETGKKGYVPRNFVCQSDTLQSETWFFGTITRKDAEKLLLKMKETGSFLIRESQTSENSYSLSILDESETIGLYVKHYRIKFDNNSFHITEREEFSKLHSLVSYYQGGAHGLRCQLTEPCQGQDPPQTFTLAPNSVTIDEIQLELQEKLFETSDGVTYKAIWNDKVTIAVKEYKSEHNLPMIQRMRQLHHKSIVKFFGNISAKTSTYCWEYLDGGNLSEYLTDCRDGGIEITEVIDIATQVATGMAYLENMGFAHKYIRARNIAVGEGSIFKVAEYGTCSSPKDIDDDAMYWLSLESLTENSNDIRSDVWSYAILIAEIINKGSNPYQDKDLSLEEFIEKLDSGYRIPMLDKCPEALHQFMLECCEKDRDVRPTFEQIQVYMESFNQRADHDLSI